MEAPEKIYLDPALDALTKALSVKTEDDVEYTRTDAFIEKAAYYIANNMQCNGYTLQTKGKFIRDFKKYMEE